GEQRGGCLVHPRIGRLGGKDDRHQQREGVGRDQFPFGFGIVAREGRENRLDLVVARSPARSLLRRFRHSHASDSGSIVRLMSTKIQAKPLFVATLTPHRSLSPVGKRIVVGLIAALALVPGFIFYIAGAWPVVGFMGLDVLAIWIALTVSMRAGKVREVVSVWPGALELRKIDAKGA